MMHHVMVHVVMHHVVAHVMMHGSMRHGRSWRIRDGLHRHLRGHLGDRGSADEGRDGEGRDG